MAKGSIERANDEPAKRRTNPELVSQAAWFRAAILSRQAVRDGTMRQWGQAMRIVTGVIVCVAALAGCRDAGVATGASVSAASVQRDADGAYTVTWTASTPGAPVDVFVASSPTAAADARKLVADDDTDGAATVPDADLPQGARLYVFVQAEGGAGVWAGERVLPLEGGHNFRDLGGYRTADGSVVKWGKLYRSGVMAGLTDADHAYLKSLGITQICDFRSSEERANEPTQWQAIGATDYNTVDYEDAGSGELRAALTGPDLSGEKVRAAMIGLYGTMTTRFEPQYKDMFARLVAGKAPLAFNCSAGKDRTGIAAGLILTALGVPRETVLADYAMSEKVRAEAEAKQPKEAKAAQAQGAWAFISRLPADVREPLMKSDPAYLEAAFKQMEAEHGSVEGYLEQRLGVGPKEIDTLRATYLEKPAQS